ncbi:MAG: hypothetical protein M1813_000015 [Trichoglossum hirsutum]|nr:MAG: hypothetical protein M1813_000015 [Trichoglossum hirsutum]
MTNSIENPPRQHGQIPTGKFGFHVTTHLANIPNDTSWRDTWEEWYSAAMRRMMELEEKSPGPDPELTDLEGPAGKSNPASTPALADGAETSNRVSFIRTSDLGTWRSPRYRLGKPYIKEYLKHIPMSAPVEDFDDRNALYALRYNLLVSTMNKDGSLVHRQTFMNEAKRLLEKYPNGIGDFEATAPPDVKL